jgi:hypothetical protein
MEVFYPDWLVNAVMVLKKNDTWHMCIDYMSLNKAFCKDIMKCSYAQSNSLTLFILSNNLEILHGGSLKSPNSLPLPTKTLPWEFPWAHEL